MRISLLRRGSPLPALAALCVGAVVLPSQPPARAQSPAGPAFEPVRYDFGQVSVLDTTEIERTFRFKNTGSAPLTIERLSASCGCASTLVGSSAEKAASGYPTLAPGEETEIRVRINLLPLRPGAQHKTVAVYARGSAQPAALYQITGTLLPLVTFSPTMLDFGRVNAGEARALTLTATLDARLAAPGALPPLVAFPPALRIEPLPEDAPAAPTAAKNKTVVRAYRVSVAPDVPIGTLTGSISFAPTDEETPARLAQSSVFVIGEVTGAVSAQPRAVAFGAVPAGQPATRQIVLTAATTAALKNRKITSDSPWITVGPADGGGGAPQEETIEIVLRPDAPAGVLQTRIAIVLENGQRLSLPVSAFVTGAANP